MKETKTKKFSATSKSSVKDLADLVKLYKLDYLKVGDVEIKKSIHEVPQTVSQKLSDEQQKAAYEEELFYSAAQVYVNKAP